MSTAPVTEPFPISTLASRYLLYSPETVTYIRATYNITGVLIGGLPQAPQQNVFLGLPLELLPEEARLLVEKGVAYIVDDVAEHKSGFLGKGLGGEERKAFHAALRRQGHSAAREVGRRKGELRAKALAAEGKEGGDWNDIPEDMLRPSSRRRKAAATKTPATDSDAGEEESLFDAQVQEISRKPPSRPEAEPEPFPITPTTSHPPLLPPPPPKTTKSPLPPVPPTYPIFAHLHSRGYFLAPGLRFGCNYMAYPGDPLRFHSHFLVKGVEWEEEFDLLELVAGGRLGTGVKKGFLLGGKEGAGDDGGGEGVRAFCVEWGGM